MLAHTHARMHVRTRTHPQVEFMAWIVSMCFVAVSLPVSFYQIFLHLYFYRLLFMTQ